MRNRRAITALFAALTASLAAADVIHLKTGRTMEAPKVVEEPNGDVSFRVAGGGTITVKRELIEWVELSDRNAATEEFQRRKKPGTPEALCDAARWAAFHGMKSEARGAWEAAVAKDPACAEAHEALGHRRHDGRWMTEDEFQAATGHVKRDGKWIPREDSEKLDKGWEYVDGKLLSPDDAKRAKGLVPHDGKWITKKELEEIEAKAAALEREEKEAEAKRRDPKDDAAILARYGSGWRLCVGKRYRLVTNVDAPPEEFDRKLVDMIDGFWPYYCETFDVHPVQKTLHNIVVYSSQDEYAKQSFAPAGSYGVYLHGEPFRPAVLWYMEKLRGSSFTTRHECGHQFMAHYLRGDGEMWVGEGMATTFECVGDVPFQDHLYRWEVIRKNVLDPGGFRFDELITGKKTDRGYVYCLGAATHLFFLKGRDGAYRKAYQEYLKSGDTKSPAALAKAVGKDLAALQSEFDAWVKEMDGKRDPRIKRPDK
ncbi:MAG: hypothetical protein IT452_13380 [Planctomycetia bacterium]|nr:hypothetical protein [Planctomycetia bacterium]